MRLIVSKAASFLDARKNRKHINEPIQLEVTGIRKNLERTLGVSLVLDGPSRESTSPVGGQGGKNREMGAAGGPFLGAVCHVLASRDFPSTMCFSDIGDSFMFTPFRR